MDPPATSSTDSGLLALHDLPAPAKLNLFLHVTGRRADGYHLLESLFVLVDWADRLHLERRDDGQLRRHDLGPALPADDLCLRAARALQQASGSRFGVDITLDKQLPAGAGMGGGSSDAATVLLGLNRLWGLHWPRARLAGIGLALGADVPFFVHGHSALVGGIGERILPVRLPALRLAVAKAPPGIETAVIFRDPALRRDTASVIVAGFPDGSGAGTQPEPVTRWIPGWHPAFGHNDLEPGARRHEPTVTEVAAWLDTRFGNSRMTGSGSAVFAVLDANGETGNPPALAMPDGESGSGLQALTGLPAGWVGRLCRSLEQHPLRGWAG
jgi:4-diphosphocytidyl-2-C-methyl-D-erythritol kinase